MLGLLCLAIALSINTVLFAIAYARQSDKLTDFAYSISFITIVMAVLVLASHRTGLLIAASSLVLIWALRLGGFLVYRIRKSGKDRRFDTIRQDFIKFLEFWLGQGLVAWLLLLPIIFLASKDSEIGAVTIAGLLLWLIGFSIESVADYQKYRFKQDPANKNHWISKGLWGYSRHPNYFGEITLWVGLYLAVFTSLSTAERLIGLISPISIVVTLMFISGVPLLEKSADKRWGNDKNYQSYKQRTPLLIPSLSKPKPASE
jgi:steroid 5-alpha reductase family enzyme